MTPSSDLVLMNIERIRRSLKRMAHEIAEKNKDNSPVLLFGIDERGYVIARDLADILRSILGGSVQVVQLPLKTDNHKEVIKQLKLDTVKNSFLVAVDDVIFSGQTMFSALKKITNNIDPPEIYTAVLVDRGHRKFPIKAEFCGMDLPTKRNEHVLVVVENDHVQQVILQKK